MKTITSAKGSKPAWIAMLIAATMLVGCGKKLSGTYAGGSAARFEQMTFKSNGKAELTAMGSVSECSYEVDGQNVKLTGGGQTQLLKIGDDESLDGGDLVGKYYLVGKDPARLHGIYTSAAGEKFVFKPDASVMLHTRDNLLFGRYTVAGSKLTIITEKSGFAPSRTLAVKIVDAKTLEGDGGQRISKQ